MMAAADEFTRLIRRAGVEPYRKVGRVHVAHDPRTPAETLAAALESVKAFAPSLVDQWGEADADRRQRWSVAGYVAADVCDDPVPRGVDQMTCPAEWLVDRCPRYHFRLIPSAVGFGFEALDGWQMSQLTPLLPAWFVDTCRQRRSELEAVVLERRAEFDLPPAREDAVTLPEPEPPGEALTPQTVPYLCGVCQATLYTTDAADIAQTCTASGCPYLTPVRSSHGASLRTGD